MNRATETKAGSTSRPARSGYAFTLIELLVVIAIIGTLSALLLPNYMAARERARDSQRKSDLKQIQKAFEMYRQDNNEFPDPLPAVGVSWTGINGTVYLNKFPSDPLTAAAYSYTVDNDNLTYTLCACIENAGDADADSVDCPTVDCLINKSYSVTQP